MIKCDNNKLIFIHLTKTGGESVTKYLKGDPELKFHLPVRYLFNMTRREEGPGPGWDSSVIKQFSPLGNDYARAKMTRLWQVWDRYLRFTVVRNPWSRLVSNYNYNIKKGTEDREFEQFVMDMLVEPHNIWLKSQVWWLSYQGKCLADRILRTESLDIDFAKLIPGAELPHLNQTKNPSKPYTDYYSDKTRRVVSLLYADDIQEFSYEFK